MTPMRMPLFPFFRLFAADAQAAPWFEHVPSAAQLATIAPGVLLKVGVRGERFWCVALCVDGERIAARVDNDLVVPANRRRWRCGDPIAFETRHALDVKTDAELQGFRVPATFVLDGRLADGGAPLLCGVPDEVNVL